MMNKCALFLILVICSCKDDPCILLDPIYTYQVQVLDASGDDLLFGDQSIYSFDSIEYNNPDVFRELYKTKFSNSINSDTLLSLEILGSVETSYFLKLSDSDFYTLDFKFMQLDEGCYRTAVDSIAINGSSFVKYESPFVILK